MTDISIERYNPAHRQEWDDFVAASQNGHFMHQRGYMEYHSDRFEDFSLMFRSGDALLGLMPANVVERSLHSHQGLTYGGLIVGKGTGGADVLAMVRALTEMARHQGVVRMVMKVVPTIFGSCPREDVLYALHQEGWTVSRRDLSTVLDYSAGLGYRKQKERYIKKAQKAGLTWRQDDGPDILWPILEEVLTSRHGVKPTHDAAEIALLAGRFPDRIKFFTAHAGDTPLGGVVLFLNGNTTHSQYLAVNDEGRACGALDFLLDALIEAHRPSHRYFSFGTSTTEGGKVLNEALLFQKEGFGGKGVVHDFYERSF